MHNVSHEALKYFFSDAIVKITYSAQYNINKSLGTVFKQNVCENLNLTNISV